MSKILFSEIPFGRAQLKNRVVMAPMTRNRAIGNVPNELMAVYYAQRAGAGLIVTEGTAPSANGLGYARIPGLYNKEHVNGWKHVTDSVHRAGGKIFVQLMHTGRVSHPENMPEGAKVLAPSALALSGTVYTDTKGSLPYPVPQEMSEEDIETTIEEYVQSSRLAIEAGFDGVELHAANGYLIEQFLNTATNQRTDRWGGTPENRIRFASEIAKRVGRAIGFDRVGIRISPYGVFNGTKADDDTETVYELLAEKLGSLDLVYIHVLDHSSMGAPEVRPSVKRKIKNNFGGHLILAGGYDADRAESDLREEKGSLVAFGKPFISNPNLTVKLRDGLPLTPPDLKTFYSSGKEGYNRFTSENNFNKETFMSNKIQTGSRVLLGLIYFVFGLNGFLNFIPTPPVPEVAATFFGALAGTGYFFPVLKATEVIGGLLLLAGFAVPVALVVLAPITLQIFLFHAFLTPGISNIVLPVVIIALHLVAATRYWTVYRPLFARAN